MLYIVRVIDCFLGVCGSVGKSFIVETSFEVMDGLPDSQIFLQIDESNKLFPNLFVFNAIEFKQ